MGDLSYLIGVEQQYQSWLHTAHVDIERQYQAMFHDPTIALPDGLFWEVVDGPAPQPDDCVDDGFVPDAWACGFVTATGEVL